MRRWTGHRLAGETAPQLDRHDSAGAVAAADGALAEEVTVPVADLGADRIGADRSERRKGAASHIEAEAGNPVDDDRSAGEGEVVGVREGMHALAVGPCEVARAGRLEDVGADAAGHVPGGVASDQADGVVPGAGFTAVGNRVGLDEVIARAAVEQGGDAAVALGAERVVPGAAAQEHRAGAEPRVGGAGPEILGDRVVARAAVGGGARAGAAQGVVARLAGQRSGADDLVVARAALELADAGDVVRAGPADDPLEVIGGGRSPGDRCLRGRRGCAAAHGVVAAAAVHPVHAGAAIELVGPVGSDQDVVATSADDALGVDDGVVFAD